MVAREIYESIPVDIDSDYTYVLAFDNKIFVMARDIGHALTFDIDLKPDGSEVRYFIPKVINLEMINNLKGISPVNTDDSYALGAFDTPTTQVALDVVDVIKGTPTDFDNDYRHVTDPVLLEILVNTQNQFHENRENYSSGKKI